MTREEAIYELKNAAWLGTDHSRARTEEAVEMAIQALSQEPTVTSTDEPITIIYPTIVCDDAISRILKRMWNCRGKHTTSIDKVAMEQIIRDELPSVTPIPDNATNGDVIKTLFSDTLDNFCERTTWEWNRWWNSPYRKGGKVE